MKIWAKIVIALLVLATLAVVITFSIMAYMNPQSKEWAVKGDNIIKETAFEESIESLDIMDNTWETALPQTELYNLVNEHFASPLPEGKTEKKAIVIGYDGCRADTFQLLKSSKKSSVNTLLNDGGHAVFSYCGGVNYPEENIQATSTAPGWSTLLTGQWAYTFNVRDNNQPKPVEPKTLLISLVEDGIIDSSAFYVSWTGHFMENDSTYINEKKYIAENKINSNFHWSISDIGTEKSVLSDLKKNDCSDFIFLTLEYTDHNGHNTGFTLENPEYVNAFRNADAAGANFIEAIKSRPNYEKEDWLILITTDHGGSGYGHGGPSIEERITFIVSNKEILK
ncbi:MAG: hypothetical protein E7515_02680 [Ruminococcaceae bacterium]|jgi:predicted AlkP superfamily pyrophosphatase or phosphodiesterase|nr:hypothetical protein [Oscillospiraceae bacterium]